MQIQAAATLTTLAQSEARATQMEAQPGNDVDELVEDGAPASTVEDGQFETEELPGVLRLLQEGHFKGVAGVRLRIVHAEKLAALEAEQVRADVAESTESLISSISSTVSELADASESVSAEQANAATSAFEDRVAAAIDTSFESGAPAGEAIETTLSTAFQALADELGLQPIPDGDKANTVVTADGGEAIPVETDDGGRDFLAELSEIFSAELANILASVETGIALPPISEPNGNGRAFEKFLAMYDDIQNGNNLLDQPPAIEVAV